MMTPLLFCVNRGYMEIVRQLIDMGADRNCSDKNVSYRVFCCRCSTLLCCGRMMLPANILNTCTDN
jgi:ankyrin repeat protein